ncbi:hypothetical protein [Streptomyces sp. FIT100]|uniref:hypothetical protein n=1 Tax=Streptomyces sp. FIT100 TaxID=2837956 RepID=UPI0021C92005|nr:hypothetical protein [Streptomyces sp. FIT100]UUN27895.1 hypothetical protein KK483_16980 [Streptomyces sp. FIT100]
MTANIQEVCAKDFVIDTCVLAHSCRDDHALYASAFSLLEWIAQQKSANWILDDNGKKAPAVETSTLYAEYHATLPPQSFPLMLLARYMRFGMVGFAARPDQQLREKIRNLIPRNKKDQVVLGAAAGSEGKVLLSNDEDDFPPHVRERAATNLQVTILSSDEVDI